MKILDSIDAYLESKNERDAKIVMYFFIGVCAFLIYIFFFEASENFYAQNKQNYKNAQNRLTNAQLVLQTQQKLNDENRSTANIQLQIDNTRKKISQLENGLKNIDGLEFNEQNLAKFLDNIILYAKNSSVIISELTNEPNKQSKDKIAQLQIIKIKLQATYQNLLKFLNDIESKSIVCTINSLHIDANGDKLDAVVEVGLWGAK
ncbi:MAG: type 4a pilus biogenesis protein PilO [Campylobacter sp.]|nr:type 4a pilus biogenesis protein PilO [Campylobacter sp.]